VLLAAALGGASACEVLSRDFEEFHKNSLAKLNEYQRIPTRLLEGMRRMMHAPAVALGHIRGAHSTEAG
jgi:hypothetical protein